MMDFLKRKKNKDGTSMPTSKVSTSTILYNQVELETKAKNGTPMTYEETEALRRYRQKDVTNQVLRLVGLLAILVVIIFAVGCFLYPYSLINFLGEDSFWHCWSNIGVYLGSIKIGANTITLGNKGWVTLGEIYTGLQIESGELSTNIYAFGPNAPALMNFFALGGWTIIPLATIGLISIVIFSIYMLVYNIKDLILVVKHLNNKTKGLVTDLANATKETALEVSEKETTTKKPRKTKKKVEKIVEPEISDAEEAEIQQKMDEYKKTLEAEEEIKVETTKPDNLKTLSDDELDKLLKQ